jgi:hypothetical protein
MTGSVALDVVIGLMLNNGDQKGMPVKTVFFRRDHAFLAVDIPIFNLYTRKDKSK